MIQKLLGFLLFHGVTLPLDATEETVMDGLRRLVEQLKAAAQTAAQPPAPAALENAITLPATVDVQSLTPNQAGELLRYHAEEIERSTGCNYSVALSRAQLLYPALVARMSSEQQSQTLANANTPPPVAGPGHKTMLGLSASASQEEFKVAYGANGGRLQPLDRVAVLNALVAFARGQHHAESGRATLSEEMAREVVLRRNPALNG